MSGAAAGDAATKQATVSDNKDTSKPLQQNKPAAQLEEDDEFEDFPVEGTTNIFLTVPHEGPAHCHEGAHSIWRHATSA